MSKITNPLLSLFPTGLPIQPHKCQDKRYLEEPGREELRYTFFLLLLFGMLIFFIENRCSAFLTFFSNLLLWNF